MNNQKYAEIELKHIQLELKNNRAQHMRHFVDQYFCYRNGYIKKTGAANWEGIVWNETVSLAALNLAKDKAGNRRKVVKEHVVPLKVITVALCELRDKNNISVSEIAKCLDRLVNFATITKEEDTLLRQAGLSSKMPPGYYQKNHRLYQDPFSRYRSAGIAFVVNKG